MRYFILPRRYYRKTANLAVIFMLATLASGCGEKIDEPAPRVVATSEQEPIDRQNLLRHVCGASSERSRYCPTDFTRLAASPSPADGKELWILGYLAIDNGQVVLFATEEDYRDMQYGRSIRLQGNREQLTGLFSEFGYKKVRLSGLFRANPYDDPTDDRLGHLLWPISGKIALPRESTEGAEEIRVDVRYLEK